MQPWRIVRRRQNEIAPELGNIIIDARSSSWPTFSSRNGRLGAELAVAAALGFWRPGASRAANAQPRTFATLPAAPPDPARAPNSHDESRQLDRRSPMSTSPNEPTPHTREPARPNELNRRVVSPEPTRAQDRRVVPHTGAPLWRCWRSRRRAATSRARLYPPGRGGPSGWRRAWRSSRAAPSATSILYS